MVFLPAWGLTRRIVPQSHHEPFEQQRARVTPDRVSETRAALQDVPADDQGLIDRHSGQGNDDLIGGSGSNYLYAWSFQPAKELAEAGEKGPDSPKVNLAIAKIYRSVEDNVRALNTLRRSFPDYSQMKPEEMTREQWDVFYPLAYWDIIVQESKARNLDPYQVAGLIRQETIFTTRARSSAMATAPGWKPRPLSCSRALSAASRVGNGPARTRVRLPCIGSV